MQVKIKKTYAVYYGDRLVYITTNSQNNNIKNFVKHGKKQVINIIDEFGYDIIVSWFYKGYTLYIYNY